MTATPTAAIAFDFISAPIAAPPYTGKETATLPLYQEAAILAAADGGHNVSSGIFSQTIGLPWPQSRTLLLAHFGLSFPVE